MRRSTSPWRRASLVALALSMAAAPSCGGDDPAPASEVTTLRVLAVTADVPYAAPGGAVTFRLTFADAQGPRPIEVTWLAGCFNPPGDNYVACYPQVLAALGGAPGMLQQEITTPEQSGTPDAVAFDLTLPDDILAGAQTSDTGTTIASAYVFFAACAGTVRPVAEPDRDAFPLECVGPDGQLVGAEGFLLGYTQVFVFADGRTNTNPPVEGLTLDDAPIEDVMGSAPVVARCETPPEPGQQGCGMEEESGCVTYKIEAVVGDVAEVDPESSGTDGSALREVVWVDYFTDRGEFDGGTRLVSDATSGYREDHATTWIPPAEAGLATIWAVVHDARGGASVTRRMVRVE